MVSNSSDNAGAFLYELRTSLRKLVCLYAISKRNSYYWLFAKQKHIKCSSNHVHDSHKFNRVAKLKLFILISLCILLLFSARELTFCKWLFLLFSFPTDTKIYRRNIYLMPNCTIPNCDIIFIIWFSRRKDGSNLVPFPFRLKEGLL